MYYFFLYATLPELRFGQDPDMDVAEFDSLCAGEMSARTLEQLKMGSLRTAREPDPEVKLPAVYAAYAEFDRDLRNRIAGRRAGQERKNAPEAAFDEIDAALADAAEAPDPLERTRLVDRIRWKTLDELEVGKEFTFGGLCVYRLRLEIFDRYRRRSAESGRANLNAAANRIARGGPQ